MNTEKNDGSSVMPWRLLSACLFCGLILMGCDEQLANLRKMTGQKKQGADLNAALATPSPSPTPEPAVPVKVQPVSRGNISTYFSTTTTLNAEESVEITSTGSGIANSVSVEVGDKVRKGELLASLDATELALALKKAKVNLQQLAEKLEKTKALLDERMVSQEVYDELAFQVQSAELEVESAEVQLRNHRITAPISGVIDQRYITTGDNVTIGRQVFRIVNRESLRAKVYVPERDALPLQVGQTAILTTESLPSAEFPGTIERKSPSVDATTGTMEIVIRFDQLDERLLPGMFMNVRIIKDTRDDILVIPKKAVLYQGDRRSVFIVTDAREDTSDKVAKRQPVKLGIEDSTQVEVLDGLNEGDSLVVIGQRGLKDGAAVEVIAEAEEEGDGGIEE